MARPTLIVMLKVPRAGQVKTRLGRDIGVTRAAWWFRHQSQSLIRRLECRRRWDLVLAVSPDYLGIRTRIWPSHLPRIPQGDGDLGQRMLRLLKRYRSGPVCLIGADIPGISVHHISHAFATLGSKEVVFGPAVDGGFWLVGVKGRAALPTTMFQNVRWSTKHALSDSLATLSGKRIGLVDTLSDVDTARDLSKATQTIHR